MKRAMILGTLVLSCFSAWAGTSTLAIDQAHFASCYNAFVLRSKIMPQQCQQQDNTSLYSTLKDSEDNYPFIKNICHALPPSSAKQCQNPQATFSYYSEADGLANLIALGKKATAEDCYMFNEDKEMVEYLLNNYLKHCAH